MSGAPSVQYNSKTLLSAGSWSGTKTLSCAGKLMKTNVTAGARTLSTAGKLAKSNIVLKYTPNSTASYQTITTSGTFTIPAGYNRAQFFAVGGGGGSGAWSYKNYTNKYVAEGGGGGGYTATSATQNVVGGTSKFTITIGKGGSYADGETTLVTSGSTTIASAAGGKVGSATIHQSMVMYGGSGGAGGSGGGGGTCDPESAYYPFNNGKSRSTGGSDGGDGLKGLVYYKDSNQGDSAAGKGQGTSTTFNGTAYAGGGGGGWIAKIDDDPYNDSAAAQGGVTGGGHGILIRSAGLAANQLKVQPTSGTPGTGGGCGGSGVDNNTSEASVLNDPKAYSITGGSGVVIVKLWEE